MLRVGYAKSDITPKLGAYLQGHNKLRYAVKVHDPLYVRCAIFEDEGLLVLMSYDVCGMNTKLSDEIRQLVAEKSYPQNEKFRQTAGPFLGKL